MVLACSRHHSTDKNNNRHNNIRERSKQADQLHTVAELVSLAADDDRHVVGVGNQGDGAGADPRHHRAVGQAGVRPNEHLLGRERRFKVLILGFRLPAALLKPHTKKEAIPW